MLGKDLKKELEKFGDDDQIFIRVKDEKDEMILVDFLEISKSEKLGCGVIVPLLKISRREICQN